MYSDTIEKPRYAQDRMETLGWSLSVSPDDLSAGWMKIDNRGVVVAYQNDAEFQDDLQRCMTEAEATGHLFY